MIKRWFESSPAAEEKKAAMEPPPAPQMAHRFGIAKVVDMVNSQHLYGLSPDAKRCAVMMALEAVEVGVEEVLQDAVLRQRELSTEEDERQETLRHFEDVKAGENGKLQAELAGITNEFMSRMQANLDEVAREQDQFRAWQRKKNQEAQQIADAAAVCVPDGAGVHGGGLTAVLERACTARK